MHAAAIIRPPASHSRGDGDGVLVVQGEHDLRGAVAEIVDDAVVKAAVARARHERDIGDVEGAQDAAIASLPQTPAPGSAGTGVSWTIAPGGFFALLIRVA